MKTKTQHIRVRVEPLVRGSLEQIARQESVELSDVARWAFRDYIRTHQSQDSGVRNQESHYSMSHDAHAQG
jgi:hypothetical protein